MFMPYTRTIFDIPFCNSNKSSLVTIFSFSKSPGKVSYFCFKRWVKNTTRWLSVLSRVKQGNREQRWQGEHTGGGSSPLLDYCFSLLSMLELGLFGKNLPLKAAE